MMSQQHTSSQQNIGSQQQQQQQQHQHGSLGNVRSGNVGSSSMATCSFSLETQDAMLVLIDHQTGLLNLVRDMDVSILRRNVLTLAKAATKARIPVVLTASEENGPNGFLLREFEHVVPDATFVARHGLTSPWVHSEFRKAIEQCGKRTLIMAGALANLCLVGPAIAAACEGYKVYAVIDSSGCTSKHAHEIALHRLVIANVTPIDTMSMITEMFKEGDIHVWRELISEVLPKYKLAIETFYGEKWDEQMQHGQRQQQQFDPRLQQQQQYSRERDLDVGTKFKDRFLGSGQRDEFGSKQQQQQDIGYGKSQDVGRYEKNWAR